MSSTGRSALLSRRARSGTPAAERVYHLIEWLRSGQPLTTPLAAEAFGVSRRTVTRDLTYLREALSLKVRFDPAQNSYVLEDEHVALPFLPRPSLAPPFVKGRLPGNLPHDEAAYPPICVRFSTRAVQVFGATSGLDLDGDVNADGTLDVNFSPPNLDEFVSGVSSGVDSVGTTGNDGG